MKFVKVKDDDSKLTYIRPDKISAYEITKYAEDRFEALVVVEGKILTLQSDRHYGGYLTREAALEAVEILLSQAEDTEVDVASILNKGMEPSKLVEPLPVPPKFIMHYLNNPADNKAACCGMLLRRGFGHQWTSNANKVTCEEFLRNQPDGQNATEKICCSTDGHGRHIWNDPGDDTPYFCKGLIAPTAKQLADPKPVDNKFCGDSIAHQAHDHVHTNDLVYRCPGFFFQ